MAILALEGTRVTMDLEACWEKRVTRVFLAMMVQLEREERKETQVCVDPKDLKASKALTVRRVKMAHQVRQGYRDHLEKRVVWVLRVSPVIQAHQDLRELLDVKDVEVVLVPEARGAFLDQ